MSTPVPSAAPGVFVIKYLNSDINRANSLSTQAADQKAKRYDGVKKEVIFVVLLNLSWSIR